MSKRKRPKPPPFEDVELNLYDMVWKWVHGRGGDFDDLLSLASKVYLELVESWDGVYPFVHQLKYKVWTAFHESRKKDLRRSKLLPRSRLDQDRIPAPIKSEFDAGAFAASLPEDAAALVMLVVDTPRELVAMIRDGGRTQDEAGRFRIALRHYLSGPLGWPRRRQDASFKIVREALA